MNATDSLAMCDACLSSIGGACAGPDALYRPAIIGKACGAADCASL